MNETQRQALRAWLAHSMGLADDRVIFANPQTGQRPKPPFATVQPQPTMRRLGAYDEERLSTDRPGEIDRIGQRRVTVTVNVYGPDGLTLAAAAQDGLERYDVRERLAAVGLTVIERGELRDLSGLLQTKFEERGQFDAVFGLAVTSTENVGWIEAIDYTGTHDAGGEPPMLIETTGTIGGA